MKLLTLGGAAVATLLAFDDFRNLRILKFEYPVLILLSTIGMMLMISAGDLIALYVGLELSSPGALRHRRLSPRFRCGPARPASSISSSARSPPACCFTAVR